MERIKLLHIITELPIGGAQDNTLLTLEYLDKKTYDITLLSSPGGEWEERARSIEGIRLDLMDILQRPINPIQDFIAFWRLYRYIKAHRYHIVHTHSSKPGFIGRLASTLAKTPIVIHTIHGFPFNNFMPWWQRKFYFLLEKIAAWYCDKLITVAELNRKKAIELKLASPGMFVNIYSGIRLEAFIKKPDTAAKRRELGIPEDALVVGMVGRFFPPKTPQYLILAARRILTSFPNTIFLLVGSGRDQVAMEQLSASLDLTHQVRFLGSRNDIPELLHIMDVYVHSSLWEGMGRALTEAMAAQRPVVATAVEGVPELVEHNKTGLLVPPKDENAIAENVMCILSDRDFAERLGRNAQERVLRDFNAMTMVKKIDLLYQGMLKEKCIQVNLGSV